MFRDTTVPIKTTSDLKHIECSNPRSPPVRYATVGGMNPKGSGFGTVIDRFGKGLENQEKL